MTILANAYSGFNILNNVKAADGFTPNLTQATTVSTGGITSQYESVSGPVHRGGARRGRAKTARRGRSARETRKGGRRRRARGCGCCSKCRCTHKMRR